jgi:hypothetical protein
MLFSVFGLAAFDDTSCESNDKVQTVTDKVQTITKSVCYDSIAQDFSYYPSDSGYTTKVLTTGTFHHDEVWLHADKEKWYGLFKGKTGFYLARTKLRIDKVFDDILDKEGEKTGWKVETINKDTSIILVGGIDFLKPHRVPKVTLAKDQIFLGDTLRINYLGVDYRIYATGDKRKEENDPEMVEVLNYKLYMAATIKGQIRHSLLVAQPDFNDRMINLIFAGDIDGDNVLDLVIDTSRHYNISSPTMYLSRPAKNGEIIKPVGMHTSVGC